MPKDHNQYIKNSYLCIGRCDRRQRRLGVGESLKICDYWIPSNAPTQCSLCRLLNSHYQPTESGKQPQRGLEILLYLDARFSDDPENDVHVVHYRTITIRARRPADRTLIHFNLEGHRRLYISDCKPPQMMENMLEYMRNGKEVFRKGKISSPREFSHRVDFSSISGWIKRCQSMHPRCQTSGNMIPGLKVIECSSKRVVPAPSSCVYAALSYVWGKVEHTSISSSDLPQILPRTIEDAATVCQMLRIEYLWVDRYCIDYSDSTRTLHQINNMHRVYSQATLTIIAKDSKDAEAGLPGVNNTYRRLPPPPVRIQNLTIAQYPSNPRTFPKSVWETRGWTYQEEFFSRRRLHFRNEEVIFECESDMVCRESEVSIDDELLETGVMQHDSTLATNPTVQHQNLMDTNQDAWSNNPSFKNLQKLSDKIWAYTRRNLTCEEDSLRAFSGILQHFSEIEHPVAHIWGLPFIPIKENLPGTIGIGESSFLASLCWEHDPYRARGDFPVGRRSKFPSWTWAGWSGTVDIWNLRPFDHSLGRVLIDYEGQNADFETFCGRSPTHRREFAYPQSIRLDGVILSHGSLHEQKLSILYQGSYYEWRIGTHFLASLKLSCPKEYPGNLQEYFVSGRLEVIVLHERNGRFYALVTDTSSGNRERVGTMHIKEGPARTDLMEDWDLYEDIDTLKFFDDYGYDEFKDISRDEAMQMLERLKEATGSQYGSIQLW